MSALLRRRPLLWSASLLLEALWVSGLLLALSPPRTPPLGVGWVIVAALLLATLNFVTAEAAIVPDQQRPALALGGALLLVLLVIQLGLRATLGWLTPGAVIGLVAAGLGEQAPAGVLFLGTLAGLALLWWRLVALAADGLGIRATLARFRLSLFALAGAALLAGLRGITAPIGLLLADVLLGLWAISLARAESVAATHGDDLPFTRRSVATLGGALALALLGAGAVSVAAGVAGPLVAGPLAWLGEMALRLLGLVIVAVALPLAWLADLWVRWFTVGPRDGAESFRPPRPLAAEHPELFLEEMTRATSPLLLWVGALLVGALLLLLGWLIARRLRRQRVAAMGAGAERASVYTDGLLGDDLRALWRSARDALAEGAARLLRRRYGTATVFDLYRNLQQLGERLGAPRPRQATPAEYLALLAARLPPHQPDLATLTEAYIAARYGGHDFSAEELRRLQAAWARLAPLAPPPDD